jgi:hypothetical protein
MASHSHRRPAACPRDPVTVRIPLYRCRFYKKQNQKQAELHSKNYHNWITRTIRGTTMKWSEQSAA